MILYVEFLLAVIILIFQVHRAWLHFSCSILKKKQHEYQYTKPVIDTTVQLPVFNEACRRVVANALNMLHDKNHMKLQVLDDSTIETLVIENKGEAAFWNEFRGRRAPVAYIHRQTRDGRKAGALQNALKHTTSDYVAIFDADFRPDRNFLCNATPYALEDVALIQTRWKITSVEQNPKWIFHALETIQNAYFDLEMAGRARLGCITFFCGTAGVWQTKVLKELGWEAGNILEDSDISVRAALAGHKMIYVPEIEVECKVPVSVKSAASQWVRWSAYKLNTGFKHASELILAAVDGRLSFRQSLDALFRFFEPLKDLVVVLLFLITIGGWCSLYDSGNMWGVLLGEFFIGVSYSLVGARSFKKFVLGSIWYSISEFISAYAAVKVLTGRSLDWKVTDK